MLNRHSVDYGHFYFMELTTLFYYDFYVGEPKANPSDWRYQPWKLAAKTPMQAACFKMYLIQDLKAKSKIIDVLILARMSIRLIVEFELTNRQGKTKYRFKKKAEYRIQEDLKIS